MKVLHTVAAISWIPGWTVCWCICMFLSKRNLFQMSKYAMYTTWILTYGLHTVCFNMKWDEITGMKPRNNISSACRRLCFFLDSRIYLWPSMWCFFFSPQVMIECSHVKVHQWWPCKNIQTCLHTYINIYIYVLWIQESIYVFILHCGRS